MAKLPEDIKKNIKRLSKAVDVPVKDLLARLSDIKETDPVIGKMKKTEHKARYAWAKLYKEYSMRGDAKEYVVMPLSTPQVNRPTIKGKPTFVGNLCALVRRIDKDEDGNRKPQSIQYAYGACWREAAQAIDNFEVGKVYKMFLQASDNSWGITITGNNGNWSEIKDTKKYKFPTIKQFYEKKVKDMGIDINLSQMDMNQKEYDTDIRILKDVTIVDPVVTERDDGTKTGRYVVMDDSIIGGDQTLFMHPDDIIYDQGSVVDFIGTIDVNDDTGQHRWNHHFQVPTDLVFEIELETVDIEDDSIDLDEEDEEETEETEEEEEDEEEEEPEEKPKKKKKSKKKSKKPKKEKEEEDDDDIFEF